MYTSSRTLGNEVDPMKLRAALWVLEASPGTTERTLALFKRELYFERRGILPQDLILNHRTKN